MAERGLLSAQTLDDRAYGLLGADPTLEYRGTVLPVGRTADGRLTAAWPQFAVDMARSAALPRHAAEGGEFSVNDVTRMGLDVGMLGSVAPAPAAGGLLGMNVWHGTPHRYAPEPDFPHGRPRLDRIGTGEGAQAYGWGWYSAENPAVGREYQNILGGAGQRPEDWIRAGDVPLRDVPGFGDLDYRLRSQVTNALREADGDIGRARSIIEQQRQGMIEGAPDQAGSINSAFRQADEFMSSIASKGIETQPGNLYRFDIPDEDAAKLLDWDAPLSGQGELLSRVRDYWDKTLGDPDIIQERLGITDKSTGQDLYKALSGLTNNQKAASEALRDAGIPGLRYFDGNSRSGADGTRNFVIWDQDVLNRTKPLERNGQTLAANASNDGSRSLGLLDSYNGQGLVRLTDEAAARLTPEERLRIAQHNAAQPVEAGGLGLPPDNTPQMRAQAMGFYTDAYHGTAADIEAFRKNNRGATYPDRIFVTPDANYASEYASTSPKIAPGNDAWRANNAQNSGGNVMPLKVKEFKDSFDIANELVVYDPRNIRSRFAAFDPARSASANLLAANAPGAGALPGLFALNQTHNEQKRREQEARWMRETIARGGT